MDTNNPQYTPPFPRRAYVRTNPNDPSKKIHVSETIVSKNPTKYNKNEQMNDVQSLVQLAAAINNQHISRDEIQPGKVAMPASLGNETAIVSRNTPVATNIIAAVVPVAVLGVSTLVFYASSRSKHKKKLKEIAETNICAKCQKSLSGGTPYLPKKKDKSNDAYIVCPNCGHKNAEADMTENN